MSFREEQKVLVDYVAAKGIRNSDSRRKILEVFLNVEHHLSVAELYLLVHKKYPRLGLATVYRTMKILCDAGLAQEIDFGDGVSRFEHKYKHQHHDHLICIKCGKCIEAMDPQIEKLQNELTARHGFTHVSHTMKIFGVCSSCNKRR